MLQIEDILITLAKCCGKGLSAKQLQMLDDMHQPKRKGKIPLTKSEGTSYVAPLGQFFQLQGVEGPAEDISKMFRALEWAWIHLLAGDFRKSLQLLRLISAPEMGKVSRLTQCPGS